MSVWQAFVAEMSFQNLASNYGAALVGVFVTQAIRHGIRDAARKLFTSSFGLAVDTVKDTLKDALLVAILGPVLVTIVQTTPTALSVLGRFVRAYVRYGAKGLRRKLQAEVLSFFAAILPGRRVLLFYRTTAHFLTLPGTSCHPSHCQPRTAAYTPAV